jgi:hypothetical protein
MHQQIFEIKIFLIMALIGHILCGISDCLLTYAPNGKVDLTNFKNYEKSKVSFKGMPLRNLSVAMLLGVCAMTLEIFGYVALCDWMRQYSETYYLIMLCSTLVMFINLALHHLFCCLVEWFFVKLNLTKEALDAVWDFFKTTCYTMYLGYLGMLTFAISFLIPVVTSKTSLPAWACIFNLLPLAVVILPTKLPAKANVIGVLMFAGLIFLI